MDIQLLNGAERKLINKICQNNTRYRSRIYLHQLTAYIWFALG
jgi:hypothetical protein